MPRLTVIGWSVPLPAALVTLSRLLIGSDGSMPVKKGRHRRFEEARALKRTSDDLDAILDKKDAEPCPECDAAPGHDHASWCMYDKDNNEAWPS